MSQKVMLSALLMLNNDYIKKLRGKDGLIRIRANGLKNQMEQFKNLYNMLKNYILEIKQIILKLTEETVSFV